MSLLQKLKRVPSKSLLQRGFKARAERISELHREELGISKFEPLDAFDLANHLGVPIVGVKDLRSDLGKEDYGKLSNVNKFSAMWMPNEDGDKIIIHNNFHSLKRQQSNLMHELAHIILDHSIPDEQARLCHMLGLHYYNEEHEQEAKHLGGCLQITRPGLLWALKNGYTEMEISDYYNASLDMVQFRMRITGVLKQRANY
jgi:Zn-dependent peptidase ImmA (M78 family)